MIKLNEDYEFERDQHCWNLHTWSDGKTKEGDHKRSKKTTYHSTLRQLCNAIIEREAGKCESMEELKRLLVNASDILTKQVEAA